MYSFLNTQYVDRGNCRYYGTGSRKKRRQLLEKSNPEVSTRSRVVNHRFCGSYFLVVLLACFCPYEFGQTSPSQTPEAQPTASPASPAGQSDSGAQPSSSLEKLSPDQAKDLLQSIDEILKFVSDDSGLPIKSSVKRELINRDQVAKYVQERFDEDEDAKRLQRSELVLKKFGLLPVDFHLRPFLIGLLREQVAGFYDYKKKSVFLLDWIRPEEQRPVMAHELTHALQDQNFDLNKWTDQKKTELGKEAA